MSDLVENPEDRYTHNEAHRESQHTYRTRTISNKLLLFLVVTMVHVCLFMYSVIYSRCVNGACLSVNELYDSFSCDNGSCLSKNGLCDTF